MDDVFTGKCCKNIHHTHNVIFTYFDFMTYQYLQFMLNLFRKYRFDVKNLNEYFGYVKRKTLFTSSASSEHSRSLMKSLELIPHNADISVNLTKSEKIWLPKYLLIITRTCTCELLVASMVITNDIIVLKLVLERKDSLDTCDY